MDLTDERRTYINKLGYACLLWNWRHHQVGDPMFMTETGRYWHDQLIKFELENPFVADLVDKNLGRKQWWSKDDDDVI
jgi:hypothetical protein